MVADHISIINNRQYQSLSLTACANFELVYRFDCWGCQSCGEEYMPNGMDKFFFFKGLPQCSLWMRVMHKTSHNLRVEIDKLRACALVTLVAVVYAGTSAHRHLVLTGSLPLFAHQNVVRRVCFLRNNFKVYKFMCFLNRAKHAFEWM